MSKRLWEDLKGFSANKEVLEIENSILKKLNKNEKCYTKELNFNNNIFLYKSDYLLENDIKQEMLHKIDGIAFTITLEGEMKLKSQLKEKEFFSRESYINMHLISQDNIYHEMPKRSSYKSLSFILKDEFLQKVLPEDSLKEEFFKSLQNSYFSKELCNKKMDAKMSLLANEIYFSPLTGELNQLYLESKTLEIIHSCLNNIPQKESNVSSKGIKFSQYDINALYEAKSILLENLENPPSIEDLSKVVKLNDFKLQLGFKKFFNLSPYAYLLEERMQKSKHLLMDSEFNINEIALMVGYSYAQNFSNAFYKRFGLRPKELMKTRKYYF